MKNSIRFLIIGLLAYWLIGLFISAPVYAAKDWGTCVVQEAATISCLEPLFENIVRAVVSLAGVALFIMLIVGGFNFLFSAGDQKKLEKAKGTISGAAIGIVVIVVAYLIIKIIEKITGVPLSNFALPKL